MVRIVLYVLISLLDNMRLLSVLLLALYLFVIRTAIGPALIQTPMEPIWSPVADLH